MTKPAFRITPKAVIDLEEIWLYTFHKCSPEQADRYYKLIIEEFQFLSKNPNAGKPIDHIREGYRSSVIKSHVIFYRHIDPHLIEIVRILHQNMDVDRRIKE